jgi:hypothetical protein
MSNLHWRNFSEAELLGTHATSLVQPKALQWAVDNLEYLNKPMRLFGSSLKVEKGSDKRDTYVMYLQPANKVSKATLCPAAATSGCKAPCLISSGQLGMTQGQRAATKRTLLWLLRPVEFKQALSQEILKAERKAKRTGIPALFRLNGTSDIDFTDVIAAHPASEFYDYTKELGRVRRNTLENYHLTFSGSMYSKQSKAALRKAVERGYHIAVPFNTKGLSSDNIDIPTWLLNFDETDLRPLDPQGRIGALSRKGSNKAERAQETGKSFFVTAQNKAEFIRLITPLRRL